MNFIIEKWFQILAVKPKTHTVAWTLLSYKHIRKDLGVMISSDLKPSGHCVEAVKRKN